MKIHNSHSSSFSPAAFIPQGPTGRLRACVRTPAARSEPLRARFRRRAAPQQLKPISRHARLSSHGRSTNPVADQGDAKSREKREKSKAISFSKDTYTSSSLGGWQLARSASTSTCAKFECESMSRSWVREIRIGKLDGITEYLSVFSSFPYLGRSRSPHLPRESRRLTRSGQVS